MSKPAKYQSYFIINKRRQYEKSSLTNSSLQLPYKSARHGLQQGKKLSVTSKCNRILWQKNKQNVVLGGVKSYNTGRKIMQQNIQPYMNSHKNSNYLSVNSKQQAHNKSMNSSINYSNLKRQVEKGYQNITSSLYHDNSQYYNNNKSFNNNNKNNNENNLVNNQNMQNSLMNESYHILPITMSQYKSQINQYPMSYNHILNNGNMTDSAHSTILNKRLQQSMNNFQIQNKLPSNNQQIQTKLINSGYQSQLISNSLKQSLKQSINISKKGQKRQSRLKQFKQQLNQTLQQQQIIQTQIIKQNNLKSTNNNNNNNKLMNKNNEQIEEIKTYTKDELCSQFYAIDDQPLRHNLIINSIKKNNNINKNKPNNNQNNQTMTIRQNIQKLPYQELQSRSMKLNTLNNLNNSNCQNNKSNKKNQQIITYNISNISTHQSQFIKPTINLNHQQKQICYQKNNNQIQTRVLSPSHKYPQLLSNTTNFIKSNQNVKPIQKTKQPQQKIQSSKQNQQKYNKILNINPKPCQSFIVDASAQQIQSKPLSKKQSLSLQTLYQQQLKRRQQANSILQSLMNMNIINQSTQ